MAEPTGVGTRLQRRKARTRTALIKAAQGFIAAGNLSTTIQELTETADVGIGSFYNHFDSKEELFEAAVEEVLEVIGELLDQLTADLDDEVLVFAQSFRLFGRFHRRDPAMSKVFLANGLAMAGSARGLAPRVRRDILAGVQAGRFTVGDIESALTIVLGAALCLGQYIHDHPDSDDGRVTDQVAEDLLRLLGVPAREARRITAVDPPDIDSLEGCAHLVGATRS